MDLELPKISVRQMRATYAALYALGTVITEKGLLVKDLTSGLARHIDAATFNGLIKQLEAWRIALVVHSDLGDVLIRGPEYDDGMERIRLAGQEIRDQDPPLRP